MRKINSTIGDPTNTAKKGAKAVESSYSMSIEEPVRQKRKYTRHTAAATSGVTADPTVTPDKTIATNTTAEESINEAIKFAKAVDATPEAAPVEEQPKTKRKYTRRKKAEDVTEVSGTSDEATLQRATSHVSGEAEVNKVDSEIATGLGDFDLYNIKVRLTFITSVLGTTPSDPEIYTNFIAGKAPDQSNFDSELRNIVNSKLVKEAAAKKAAEEQALAIENGLANSDTLPEEDPKDDLKSTIFPKLEDGTPIVYDYQIKGFFKDTCQCLKKVENLESADISAFKKIIDKLVFVFPREIPITNVGEITSCQRPLRAQTPQGERISIAASECIPAGSQITFIISSLSKKYVAAIREWLNYGQFSGLGQWRNSGRGRFVWEEIDIDTGEIVGGNKSKFDALGIQFYK